MLEIFETLGIKISSEPWSGAEGIPYFLYEIYDFRKVDLDGTLCVFALPRGEIPAVQAITKHFTNISAAASIPVVLKLNGLSEERRKALIAYRIPFVAIGQTYLPFLGIVLRDRLYDEPKSREKLMPSAQLLLFAYLYQESETMYTSLMPEKIGVSAMQITRAVRQLQRLNLFEVSKEGVHIVVKGKANHRALFEEAYRYIIDPVRRIVYLSRNDKTVVNLPFSGISAMSELTMLAASDVPTYAYFSKTDGLLGESGLSDRRNQVRVEIWKYAPNLLSKHGTSADPLSVIASLKEEREDARVEQAVEDILKKMWDS